MDKLRRWKGRGKPIAQFVTWSKTPDPNVWRDPVLPLGEWLHWTICANNKIINEVARWPNVEF